MKLYFRFFAIVQVVVAAAVLVGVFNIAQYLKDEAGTKRKSSTLGSYVYPWNSKLKGLEFKFDENTLQLVQQLIKDLNSGKTVNNISVASYSRHLTPVTAVSRNHFVELMAHLSLVATFIPGVNIVVYDLGLTQHQVKTLQNLDFVDYRKFDFSLYPAFVRNLKKYAWKTLVIQKTLSEFGGALWLDACIVFQETYDKVVHYMVENNSSFLFYIRLSGHSIVSATKPRMFRYLPMKNAHLAKTMPQSGGMLVFSTKLVRNIIMKWAIVCSLLEDCIAPPGSYLDCGDNYPVDEFGGCHRYDQSIFTIVVSNAYDSQTERYSLRNDMLTFAYPWRVRNDSILFSREAIPVYVVMIIAICVTFIIFALRRKLKRGMRS